MKARTAAGGKPSGEGEQSMAYTREAREGSEAQESLRYFDNHDPRIPYYELALEQDLADTGPEIPLPAGYRYVRYTPGLKEQWIEIEQSAREFRTREEGEEAWGRYYAGREKELESRMFFVADGSGRLLATATAFYDVRRGDDGENAMLHWVAVRRDAQGKGLSKPLVTHAVQCMKDMGYRWAAVPTQTTTWLACKVYLDLGFRPVPKNAERNREGWRIIRTLTGHPALAGFEPFRCRDDIVNGAARRDQAVRCYDNGYLCSQAVPAAYAEQYGLAAEQALKLGTCLGMGMRKGEVCGACTGALMVLGLAHGDPKNRKAAYERSERFLNAFREENGSYLCNDLLGCDVRTPEGVQYALDRRLFTEFCPKMVASAVGILEDILRDSAE